MAIEYVDPREIEADPLPGETAAHRAERSGDRGRLAAVDAKLRDALCDLEAQVARIASINAGLFGSDPQDNRPTVGSVVGDDAGLVVSLETRAAELRRLVCLLEQSIEETASLT